MKIKDFERLKLYDLSLDAIAPYEPPKPFIEIFSTHPDALDLNTHLSGRRREEENYDIDTFDDEMLESMGAKIIETQTYNPETGRTIVGKK